MCFVLEEEGSMFGGDTVLNGNTSDFEDLSMVRVVPENSSSRCYSHDVITS